MAETDRRLFGTDGVRGTAGVPPLDPETVARLGAAVVRVLPHGARRPHLLIGRDTRESGPWIEEAFTRGATAAGARVTSLGVVPTPAVAYLTGVTDEVTAGIVISASHNPFADNGIKIFSGHGVKFTEAVERAIEADVAEAAPLAEGHAASHQHTAPLEAYAAHLRRWAPSPDWCATVHVVLDCAHGATTTIAPALFASLGCRVDVMGDHPSGRNINEGCGSTHPEALAARVVALGATLGVAFDGDGDRAIVIDAEGRVVNGDAVLLLCAEALAREGRLRGDAVVATVMSNIGLELALRDRGIGLVRCPVGDRHVAEAMQAHDLVLGGEQSGHLIFGDVLSTGDGLCTAIHVLRAMASRGASVAALASGLVSYPQVLLNVRVRERRPVESVPALAAAIDAVTRQMAGQGRVLVRYSGTEPLLRIMLEGPDDATIRHAAETIADVARAALGE